jgi:hypothetical protein
MELQRLPKATITFVAVAERTSDAWASLALGFFGALPVIVVIGLALHWIAL